RRMGFQVAAVGRGADIAQDALALGAHVYIDADHENPTARLQAMGGAQAVVATVAKPEAVSGLLKALAPQGRLVVLAAGKDPLSVVTGPLVRGERAVIGSITGSPYENEKTLAFSVLAGVRPWIETLPLERAEDAYRRMKSGNVKFRMVLTTAASTGG
ncbi:MAG TPA: zinc-binding dehydrogenase, partial [Ramlibacter sp.]|nr:zinc-binding dehydrogenase [Ramlibacter sp.]